MIQRDTEIEMANKFRNNSKVNSTIARRANLPRVRDLPTSHSFRTRSPGTVEPLADLNDNIRSSASPTLANQPAESPITPFIKKESNQWRPPREQVDAYIRSLERTMLRKAMSVPSRQTGKHITAAVRNSHSSLIFCGLIALILGCFTWLLQIIFEGFK